MRIRAPIGQSTAGETPDPYVGSAGLALPPVTHVRRAAGLQRVLSGSSIGQDVRARGNFLVRGGAYIQRRRD